MICTVERYRTHTLDTTSSAASASAMLAVAQDLVEEALDRRLDSASRTETCTVRKDGRIYPRAIPVTVAPSGTVTEFHGRAILGATWDTNGPSALIEVTESAPTATVTYTGGYLTYADPAATEDTRVPVTLEREIALIAQTLIGGTALPGGATAVRLGDAAATYATPLEALDVYSPGASKRLKRYRRAVT